MTVLIASAHAKTRRNKLWRDLQHNFIKKYTKVDYNYAIVANDLDVKLFKHADMVTRVSGATHLQCIHEIMGLFESSNYEYLLLLDSDAWPVRDWYDIIVKMLGTEYSYSAPMRTENYDTFPHPSAFFVPRLYINSLNFGFSGNYYNMLGIKVSDVGTAMPQFGRTWVPLMKTNVWAPHPLFFSIYGDLFYHHGAGSRGIGTRLPSLGVYNHILQRPNHHKKIYDRLTSELRKAPFAFINKLRGKHNGFIYN